MSKGPWISGQWNAICDVCGFQRKSGELTLRWDGLRTCKECWEMRHPIDLTKAPPVESTPDWTRPLMTDYIEVTYITTGNQT